jgi:sec-independent protein translocase protein TatA
MLAFFGAGGYEWIIVLIVALLLFGKRLPEVMKSMGKGVRMFKKGVDGLDDEDDLSSEGNPDGMDSDTEDGMAGPEKH